MSHPSFSVNAVTQTPVRTEPDAGAAALAAECCVEAAEVMCDAGAPVVMCAVEAPPPFGGESSRLSWAPLAGQVDKAVSAASAVRRIRRCWRRRRRWPAVPSFVVTPLV